MLHKKLLIAALCFCAFFSAFAQKKSFSITVKWQAATDGAMSYLVGYYGDETTIYDSVPIKKGYSKFKGKNLPDGYYEAYQINGERIKTVVCESRKFTYDNNAAGEIEGSPEALTYQLAHFQTNPYEPLTMALVDASSEGHDLVYKYLALEFFGLDSCASMDARLLHHPQFNQFAAERLQSEKIDVIDAFFNNYGPDTEIGQYYLGQTLKYYNMDNNVAYDDILMHIYDKYYTPNHLQLFSENYERRLARGIERKRHMALGAEVPVIEAKNSAKATESTANITRPLTVLWFWDADCEDCLEETPILNRMYIEHQEDYDFEIFGCCITDDVNRWQKVSNEMDIQFINTCYGLGDMNYDIIDYFNILTTPACILIDQNHKILLRQFSLEQLEDFFNNFNQDKNNE